MTITKRCFASKVQIKVEGYTNQNPEKIALAVKQMASKGWVVAEKKEISGYTLITFVKKEDLGTYLSFEDERNKVKSMVSIKSTENNSQEES